MNTSLIKQNSLLVGLTFAMSLSWLGCKKSEPVVKAGPPPSGPVRLTLKWPVGSHTVLSLDLKQTAETQVPGMANPMKQDMTMGQRYDRSVLKALPDGGHVVELEFLGTRLAISGVANQPALAFDSTDKSYKTNPVAAVFKKLTGAKVQYFLNATNGVERIEGVDEFQKQLATIAQSDPMGQIKSMFSEESFRNWMREAQNLPEMSVQPGDTWPVKLEIAMGQLGTLVTDSTYTLASWEKRNEHNCARIEFKGTMQSKPGENPNASGMKMSIEGGKNSGETWFDLEQGRFMETTMNQEMTLRMTMPNQAQGAAPGKPMIITTVLNQIITVKHEPAR